MHEMPGQMDWIRGCESKSKAELGHLGADRQLQCLTQVK